MVTSLGSQAPLCLSALEEDYEKRAQLYKSVITACLHQTVVHSPNLTTSNLLYGGHYF